MTLAKEKKELNTPVAFNNDPDPDLTAEPQVWKAYFVTSGFKRDPLNISFVSMEGVVEGLPVTMKKKKDYSDPTKRCKVLKYAFFAIE